MAKVAKRAPLRRPRALRKRPAPIGEIIFWVNGKQVTVIGDQIFLTVAEFLRLRLGLYGTKVVCAEGDCGACTVVLVSLKGESGGSPRNLVVQAVNSCILSLYQVHGCHLITVEAVSDHQDLHPVQKAIVDNHATQCGYCTPGIVMSCVGWLENKAGERQVDQRKSECQHKANDNKAGTAHKSSSGEESLKNHLTGNLCRCTGYLQIKKAIHAIAGQVVGDVKDLSVVQRYQTDQISREMRRLTGLDLHVVASIGEIFSPISERGVISYLKAHPQAKLTAGNSDLGVVFNKQCVAALATPGQLEVLYLGRVADLKGIRIGAKKLEFGSGTLLSEVEDAMEECLPELSSYLRVFASPQIKRVATLGGNIANASPIGDLLPPLLALGASVLLLGPRGTREVELRKFFLGYRKTAIRKGEILKKILIPRPNRNEFVRFFKVCQRKDVDISTVSASFWAAVEGKKIKATRIALGGVAATPVRLYPIEKELQGLMLSDHDAIEAVIRRVPGSFSARSDFRGSKSTRELTIMGLFHKFHLELGANL